MVRKWYLSMYRRIRTKPALRPYTISVNCSNCVSVGFTTSPIHAFPMRMFRGLLFRNPLGSVLLESFMIEEEPRVNNGVCFCNPCGLEERMRNSHAVRPNRECVTIEEHGHDENTYRVIYRCREAAGVFCLFPSATIEGRHLGRTIRHRECSAHKFGRLASVLCRTEVASVKATMVVVSMQDILACAADIIDEFPTRQAYGLAHVSSMQCPLDLNRTHSVNVIHTVVCWSVNYKDLRLQLLQWHCTQCKKQDQEFTFCQRGEIHE